MLARPNRLTRGADYKAVVRRGRRCAGAHTVTYVRTRQMTTDAARFGFIVSRQVGSAVVRNTVRRRLKAVCAEALPTVRPGSDIVIRALPDVREAAFADLRDRGRPLPRAEGRHESATLPYGSVGDGAPRGFRLHSALFRSSPAMPSLSLLHGYRATISHAYGDVCKYYPSCSAYAVGAVQQHGAVKGSAMAAARLARCHPWAKGGVDDVPAPHELPVRTHPARVRRTCLPRKD